VWKGQKLVRETPISTSFAEMFLVQLPKLADLTTSHRLEVMLVVWRVLHQLVELRHCALTIPFSQPVQKVCRDMIARVPSITTRTPMRRHESGTEANPIYGCGRCGLQLRARVQKHGEGRRTYAPAMPSMRPLGQAPWLLYW
jgi:hypothetical protein